MMSWRLVSVTGRLRESLMSVVVVCGLRLRRVRMGVEG